MKTNLQQFYGDRVIDSNGTIIPQRVIAVTNDFTVDTDITAGDFHTPNAQKFTKRYFQNYQGYLKNESAGSFVTIYGTTDYLPSHLDDSGIDSATFNKCLDKLNNAVRGDIDLSIDIFQSRQTREMVKDGFRLLTKSAYELAQVAKAVKRGNLKFAADAWLAYTYGVKPTMSTIYSTLKKAMENKQAFRTIRVRATDKQEKTEILDWNGDQYIKETIRTHISNRCEMKIDINVSDDAIASLAGYTSLNPVSIAWELVPFSFVADWVVDVGGYLRNLESSIAYAPSFLRGYTTQSVRIEVDGNVEGVHVFDGGAFTQISYSGGRYLKVVKQRDPMGSYPAPYFPSVNPSLGPSRLISSASLLAQQIKSWQGPKRR